MIIVLSTSHILENVKYTKLRTQSKINLGGHGYKV